MSASKRLSVINEWFRVWLPYQFVPLKNAAKHVYLPLNRNYKPLGVGPPRGDSPWVDYDKYLHQAVKFDRDPHSFKDVWHDVERLYLYEDAQSSQVDYFFRLEKLMKRTVRLMIEKSED